MTDRETVDEVWRRRLQAAEPSVPKVNRGMLAATLMNRPAGDVPGHAEFRQTFTVRSSERRRSALFCVISACVCTICGLLPLLEPDIGEPAATPGIRLTRVDEVQLLQLIQRDQEEMRRLEQQWAVLKAEPAEPRADPVRDVLQQSELQLNVRQARYHAMAEYVPESAARFLKEAAEACDRSDDVLL